LNSYFACCNLIQGSLKTKSMIKRFNLKAFSAGLTILFFFALQTAQANTYKSNSSYAASGGGAGGGKGGGGGCNGGGKGGAGGCHK
jgi:hypothetical protein